MVQDFRKLEVWQDAVNFDKILCAELDHFPQKELYAMTSQLRKASLSISSLISQGCGGETNDELKIYLSRAMRSCKEVESMLIIAYEKGYIKDLTYKKLNEEINRVGKRLNVFLQRVKEKTANQDKNRFENGKANTETA